MANDQPFAIEILDLGRGEPVVVDRVTGATVYMEEAKRIGRHLLSLTGLEVGCGGVSSFERRFRPAVRLARRRCQSAQLVNLQNWLKCWPGCSSWRADFPAGWDRHCILKDILAFNARLAKLEQSFVPKLPRGG